MIEAVQRLVGPRPHPEARTVLARLRTEPELEEIYLNYDWIVDFDALAGLEFRDGSEGLTLHLPKMQLK